MPSPDFANEAMDKVRARVDEELATWTSLYPEKHLNHKIYIGRPQWDTARQGYTVIAALLPIGRAAPKGFDYSAESFSGAGVRCVVFTVSAFGDLLRKHEPILPTQYMAKDEEGWFPIRENIYLDLISLTKGSFKVAAIELEATPAYKT